MDYAVFSNKSFSTSKKVLTRKPMSDHVRNTIEFMESHVISVTINPSTNEARIEASRREEDNA